MFAANDKRGPGLTTSLLSRTRKGCGRCCSLTTLSRCSLGQYLEML